MKRVIAVCLAMFLTLLLAACGGGGEKPTNADIQGGALFEGKGSADPTVKLGTPSVKLDAQSVYDKITYTAEMFYGNHVLAGGDAAQTKFGEDSKYNTYTIGGDELQLSELPFRFDAGKATMSHSVNYIEDYTWMRAYFMRKLDDGTACLYTVLCAYEIDGNKLILKPLDSLDVDKENNKISYAFADVTLEYTFEFSGRELTLSTGESSVALTTGLDPYGEHDYWYVESYLSPESKSVHNIDKINFRYDGKAKTSSLYFELVDGTSSYNSAAHLTDDGLFTFTLALEDSTETYQYVCFYCGYDGLVLTDGETVYYYNDTYSDRNKFNLAEYLTEDQSAKLDELTDSQLEAIVEKKEDLMSDLAAAFNTAGINVTVDEKSGELAMDASVLFGGDSAVLTDAGKVFLNDFVDVYTSIVFSEKYDGFVSKTMVEGHTAPVAGGTYESGLPLSEERANNVKDYCVSADTGIDVSKLAAALEAVGLSNSKPIYNSDGEVDMAACRRVSFKFIINLDYNR